MSKPSASLPKSSSLSSLSKPTSAPASPHLTSMRAASPIDSVPSAVSTDTVISQLQATATQHATDMHTMQTAMQSMMAMIVKVDSKLDHFKQMSSPTTAFAFASDANANANANAIPMNLNTQISNQSNNSTQQARVEQKEKVAAAAKTLYDLPAAEQQAILQYAQAANNVNSSFQTLDETIHINDENKVSTNANTYNFISKLMPVSTDPVHAPSMDEIFKAGLKAATSNPKVKDANAFIELLIEQAKVITSASSNTVVNGTSQLTATADYLHYLITTDQTIV